MLRRFAKKILLTICLAVFAIVSIAGIVFSSSVRPVNATAEESWQTAKFTMEDGVSLKLNSEKNGMRFIVSMDESVYNFLQDKATAKLGIVISTQWYIEAAGGDYLNIPKKIGGELKKNKLYKNGDVYCANACITNIQINNFEYNFTAVAYIEYNGVIRYTEYNSLARNNLYDTVNMAVLNGYAEEVLSNDVYTKNSTEGSGWYGTEQFPIVVESRAEYDAVTEIAETKDLSFYHVLVEEGATPSNGFANEEYKPTILSNAVKVIDLINKLPDGITMPDAIGLIGAIREAEKEYNALGDADKAAVSNYEKLAGLLSAIVGYDRVYKNDGTDGTVIPSYVPGGYSSTIGGAASTREDALYGNVLRVQSAANGRAALYFTGFPSIGNYQKVYFYVRILGVSCDIYLSDGITNDGWGLNWKNTWSTSGFWCNADTWRLIEIDVAKDGYIGTDFALGFRTKETGIAFEISDFYGSGGGARKETGLTFGARSATGESNEYGMVYNISREQWYIDNNNVNTIGTLQTNKLANALPSGYQNFYFWMYNGTEMEYTFHLAGDVSGAWTDSKDTISMPAGQWTKITISAEDIELNKNGQWYVYILGGDGSGAAKDGWKISTIYAGPHTEWTYTDHANLKLAIALIDALPATITYENKLAVEKAAKAYDALTTAQQALISNVEKLEAAKAALGSILEIQAVIELIDAIDSNNLDVNLVEQARQAYNGLSDSQKAQVTNLAKLQEYEDQLVGVAAAQKVKALIDSLPDSVTMPDHLVLVPRIEGAKAAYDRLNNDGKKAVSNYTKLRSLLHSIKGYTTVYRQTVDGVDVIPSHVPGGYSSTIGGSATLGSDGYYGNYLKVTPNEGGKAAIQFKNFPDISQYAKIYFNIRVVGTSCDIYLSDGINNDGWGDNWKNTWSMDGFWTNNGSWIQKEVAVSTGIFVSNWALGLRSSETDVSFEITDIIAWKPELGTNSGLTFGNFTASGAVNEYGTVYNFTQGWSSNTDMGAFNQNTLKNALAEGHDTLHFWIYNPQDTAVDFGFSGDMNAWNPSGEYVTSLAAKAWTEVIITPKIIQEGTQGTWFVNVTTGAGTSGWKISPIYSYAQEDLTDKILFLQERIDSLNTQAIDENEVTSIRDAYEDLPEENKAQLTIDNLIACEEALYGNVDNAPFIVQGTTKYKLYHEADVATVAALVQAELKKATGVDLAVVTSRPETITKYRYAIVVGYEDLAQKLGIDCPTEAEGGASAYTVKRVGRTVFIVARNEEGYRLAMLEFLYQAVGYEMISEDCVVYGKDGTTLPSFDGKETPSFVYRQISSKVMSDAEVSAMGMHKHTDIWIPIEGYNNGEKVAMDMHNTLYYLPKATYGSMYPTWYYTKKDAAGTERTQICPTAGGNETAYQAMLNVIQEVMVERITNYPTTENISFSIMDSAGGDACTCTRCKLYNTAYGNNIGFTAAWIDLINDINANIQEYIRMHIPGRKLTVSFLAYRATEAAPAKDDLSLLPHYVFNANGSYEAEPNKFLKCDEGVAVWVAPINAKYTENFNHASNAETLATIKKWSALSSKVFVWMYGTNFANYLYPYNSWQASAENYKILSDLGNVRYVWNSNVDAEGTAFTDLKQYIDSVFMRNANADYETVLDTYFTNYFGAAAEPMRKMFDAIVAQCNAIEANYNGLGRGIYDNVKNVKGNFLGTGAKTYWSKEWLESLMAYIEEAKAAIGEDEVLYNRILKESLFPRYVLYRDYNTSTSNRTQFEKDCGALGLTHYTETGLISGGNLWKY